MALQRFDAVIFDCDGTLVDSEVLGNQVLVDYLAELGIEMSLEEALHQFTGGKMADTVAYVEQRLCNAVPDNFVTELRSRFIPAFETHLQPIAGIESVLQGLQLPYCVASSSPRMKIELSLRATGLLPYFGDRIFSAYDVGSFKPEPGLFLHAAQSFRVEPERCAVVEDSIVGVQAGIAAGMTVFGYAPAGNEEIFKDLGARPFSHMDELLPLLHATP